MTVTVAAKIGRQMTKMRNGLEELQPQMTKRKTKTKTKTKTKRMTNTKTKTITMTLMRLTCSSVSAKFSWTSRIQIIIRGNQRKMLD